MPLVAIHTRCDEMRLSSLISIRIHTARCRYFDVEQLLDGHGEAEFVDDRAQVVHARHVGRALDVAELLAGLLHAGVQVADDRLGAQHELAVEFEHETQDAVGRRVRRSHVDDHRLVVVTVEVDRRRVEGQAGKSKDRSDLTSEFVDARGVAALELLGAFGGLGGQQVDALRDADRVESLIAAPVTL